MPKNKSTHGLPTKAYIDARLAIMEQGRRAREKSRNKARSRRGVNPFMVAYDRMIRDPCGAPLAKPPYAGGDSGYLIRLTTAFNPSGFGAGLVSGTDQSVTFTLVSQPASFPNLLLGAAVPSTVSPTYAGTAASNTFFSSGVVKAYRPVAACARWVPTGPISKRQGMISLSYKPGLPVNANDTATIAAQLALAQDSFERCPNGSAMHEIRWLPTPADESYVSPSGAFFSGGGTLTVAGIGVDGVATSTSSWIASGYVELTYIFEWLPTSQQGIQTTVEPTVNFTSQQYQATLGDVGSFLLHGVRQASRAATTAAVTGVMQSIAGLSSRRRGRNSFPAIRDEL